jgi:hypothetical protein
MQIHNVRFIDSSLYTSKKEKIENFCLAFIMLLVLIWIVMD